MAAGAGVGAFVGGTSRLALHDACGGTRFATWVIARSPRGYFPRLVERLLQLNRSSQR